MANSWGQVFGEIFGMLITFIIINIIFSLIYRFALDKSHFTTLSDKEETTFIDFFYFATTTTSSVGYGEIVPKTELAKIIVIINQFVAIGGFYLIPSHIAELAHNAFEKKY